MDRASQISALHAEYQRLTGLAVSLMGREWVWWEWLKRDLTLADLQILIREKQRKVRIGQCTPAALAFRFLIGNVDAAEEDILTIRAASRHKTDPHRTAILSSTGRPSPSNSTTRPASVVIQNIQSNPAAAEAALAELKKFKSSL